MAAAAHVKDANAHVNACAGIVKATEQETLHTVTDNFVSVYDEPQRARSRLAPNTKSACTCAGHSQAHSNLCVHASMVTKDTTLVFHDEMWRTTMLAERQILCIMTRDCAFDTMPRRRGAEASGHLALCSIGPLLVPIVSEVRHGHREEGSLSVCARAGGYVYMYMYRPVQVSCVTAQFVYASMLLSVGVHEGLLFCVLRFAT